MRYDFIPWIPPTQTFTSHSYPRPHASVEPDLVEAGLTDLEREHYCPPPRLSIPRADIAPLRLPVSPVLWHLVRPAG